MNILDQVTQDYLKKEVPAFNVGDTVKVHVKIKEGSREESRSLTVLYSRNKMAELQKLSPLEGLLQVLVLKRHSRYTHLGLRKLM